MCQKLSKISFISYGLIYDFTPGMTFNSRIKLTASKSKVAQQKIGLHLFVDNDISSFLKTVKKFETRVVNPMFLGVVFSTCCKKYYGVKLVLNFEKSICFYAYLPVFNVCLIRHAFSCSYIPINFIIMIKLCTQNLIIFFKR